MATGRAISISVNSHGANKVAQDLNRVNTIGNKVNAGFKRMTAGIAAFAKKVGIATIAITALVYAGSRIAKAVLTPFMNLEKTMARVRIAEGATIQQTRMLTDVAGQLGRDTLYSASQAAEGMLFLAKAGLNVEQTMAAIPGVLQAAIVEELDLGTAADIVTGLLNEFALSADQAGLAADVLAKGSNLAKTNMPEMSEGLKFFGVVAHELGYNIQESVAMLDVLAGKMIRGTMAGTAMRQSMILFQKIQAAGTFVTKAQSDAIGRLGLDVNKLAKQISSGDLTFIKFISTLKKAGATTGDFASVFEQRAAVAVNALAEAAEDALPRYIDELNNAVGFTKTAGGILEDTLWGQTQQIKSSIETMTNALAETFAPGLKDFLENELRPFINDITEAWKTGGDTWQEKMRSVWDTQLRPEMEKGLASLDKLVAKWIPKIADTIGTLAQSVVIPVFKGLLAGIWNLFSLAFKGWRTGIDYVLVSFGDLIINAFLSLFDKVKKMVVSFVNTIISGLNHLPGIDIGLLGGAPASLTPEQSAQLQQQWALSAGLPSSTSAGAITSSSEPILGLSFGALGEVFTSSAEANLAAQIELTRQITHFQDMVRNKMDEANPAQTGSGSGITDFFGDIWRSFIDAINGNTEAVDANTEATGGEGGNSFANGIGKAVGSFVSKGIESMVGGIEGVLIGAVTEPITGALADYLAPTMDKIGVFAGKVLHFFDPLILLFNKGLDVFIDLMGGKDYEQGRYTGEGAYQVHSYGMGGIAATPQLAMVGESGPEIIRPLSAAGSMGGYGDMSVESSVNIEHIEVNGSDGEAAGEEIAQEISRHEELTTRQIARSMQQGMLKREAMER